MRFIVDVSQNQSDIINRLVEDGRYPSVGQFIATAIANQIYIEGTDAEMKPSSSTEKPHRSVLHHDPKSTRLRGSKPLSVTKKFHDEDGYPESTTMVELKLPAKKIRPPTMSMPNFDQLAASLSVSNENDSWLWGQINKILPIKVGARVLYLLLLDSGESIELEQFREKAAEMAVNVGDMIREHEYKKDKKRDERISAGLPGGPEPFKSKNRFKSHFLGYMRKDGKLDGGMCILKLINMRKDDRGRLMVGLTEAGVDFACLENPPMDLRDLDHSLAKQEIDFYLKHVQTNVPGEFRALRWLLKTVAEGVAVRDEISKKLKAEMGNLWGASEAVISTQRAGLTSRASELGLISTTKTGVGVSVRYEVTAAGKALLGGV